jgi:hypothetical protein
MRIHYAIVSCNSDPFYLDFWPLVSKLWKTRLGITPVLCYVDSCENSSISREYGVVTRYEPIDDIPLTFQAQWARFFEASRYEGEVVVISDIDMLPLSRYFFVEQIVDIDENLYLHLSPYPERFPIVPAPYNVAKGNLIKQVLEIGDSWPDSCRSVYKRKLGPMIQPAHLDAPLYWCTDEYYLGMQISRYPDQSVFHFLTREGGLNGRRIDRACWNYSKKLLGQNYYFDAHCPRPYNQFKHLIDPVAQGRGLPYRHKILLWISWFGKAAGEMLEYYKAHPWESWKLPFEYFKMILPKGVKDRVQSVFGLPDAESLFGRMVKITRRNESATALRKGVISNIMSPTNSREERSR